MYLVCDQPWENIQMRVVTFTDFVLNCTVDINLCEYENRYVLWKKKERSHATQFSITQHNTTLHDTTRHDKAKQHIAKKHNIYQDNATQ